MTNELDEVRSQWNQQAEQWNQHIGDEGDQNRRESSDSYLWKYVGDINDKVVLDAGCGNGYLTIKLAQETYAKSIYAVDLSEVMIDLAIKNTNRRIDDIQRRNRIVYAQDSITELKSIGDSTIDLIISNYVLMDTPELELVVKAFQRVLKPGGRAIIIILHPCFDIVAEKNGPHRSYTWSRSYFDETPDTQKWSGFSLNMYHRPLSVYLQTFHQYGLYLKNFDEPKFYSAVHKYDFTCAALFHLKKQSIQESSND